MVASSVNSEKGSVDKMIMFFFALYLSIYSSILYKLNVLIQLFISLITENTHHCNTNYLSLCYFNL